MKPYVKVFRDIASQTCHQKSYPFPLFLNEYGLRDVLLDAEEDTDSAEELAVDVLAHCCLKDGKFNNFHIGFLCVMYYLNDQLGPLEGGAEKAYRELLQLLNGKPTRHAIFKWIERYYG